MIKEDFTKIVFESTVKTIYVIFYRQNTGIKFK